MYTRTRGQPRAKTKTFTGCWTCRKRKVKCDETQPSCQRCVLKGLECAGYTTRLKWLCPETGDRDPIPETDTQDGSSLRRSMFNAQPSKVLDEHELDRRLRIVEAQSPREDSPTTCHGPFAVFRLPGPKTPLPTDVSSSPSHLLDVVGSPHGNPHPHGGLIDELEEQDPNCETWADILTAFPTGPISNSQDSIEICSVTSLERLDVTEGPVPDFPFDDEDPTRPGVIGASLSDARATVSHVSESHVNASPLEFSKSVAASPTTQQLRYFNRTRAPSFSQKDTLSNTIEPLDISTDVRHLLHHYVSHVVDLMTVIKTSKSPWKSVHLPRALQGIGELSIVRSTSHARNALLNALLSISAYNLAACHTLAVQQFQAQNWREIALRCRARALTQLKASLQKNCSIAKRGKYKEVLAAMLSMITIDVCSGETRSSEWHLKGLEGFIDMSRRGSKRNYSKKAQSLHRVYFYLRVMRESTDLRYDSSVETPACLSLDLPWLSKPLCFLEESNITEDWVGDRSQADGNLDPSACEFVYGIPFDLLVLMGKTSDLIRRKLRFSQEYPASAVPQILSNFCDSLESEILDWPVDQTVERISGLSIEEDFKNLMEHQTRAFHQAIIIYFSRLVRSVHRNHLQPYAEHIIDHLDAVEKIKFRTDLATGCILWPAFIGAAESTSDKLQSRYIQWFESVRYYGLGSYDKAHEVVLEVWKRQRSGDSMTSSGWPVVVQSKDIKLMLT